MGVEKEGSKSGGGYVGGFFQLFDWKAKSRKKLFSSKSDLPERSKQGKRSDGNLPMTRLHLMDEDEAGAGSSIRGSSDISYASSVADDDGYGARAPGVVARLMGLDSLPTSSSAEPNSTPYFDTQSLRNSSLSEKHCDYYHDPEFMFSGNLLNNKKDGLTKKFVESRSQKLQSRPIEKFQTEMLPPKSAKSIPITHHKLLSPIKSPGFIPSKTAAHIMEAAAKIIEPSPQATAKAKMLAVGSSSIPLKVRDLREKLEVAQNMSLIGSLSTALKVPDLKVRAEATQKTSRPTDALQRPVESNASKYLKGRSLNKSWNESVGTSSRSFSEREEGSSCLKNKGKSISLAIQAKVNVQRREGLNSTSSRGFVGQKEQNEVLSSQPLKSQPNTQKCLHKKFSAQNATGVLRQNNQKQNCLADKDKLPSKSMISNLQGRKVMSANASSVRQKTAGKISGSKVGSRKLSLEVAEREKGNSNYSTNNIPRKRRSINGNLHVETNQVDDNMLVDKDRKDIDSNPVIDKHFSWIEESEKKGTDVVSFTFTAPLTRSVPSFQAPGQVVQRISGASMDNRGKRLLLDTDSMNLSSVGYNMIGGDALSALLEQKLRDLTNSIESSSRNSIKARSASSSMSNFQGFEPTIKAGSTRSWLHENKDQGVLSADKLGSSYGSDLFSTDPAAFRLKHVFQGVGELEECSSTSTDSRNLLDCRRPSPVSVLESSFSTESGSSLDSADSSCTDEGSNQCSSIQAQEVVGFHSSKKFRYVDAEMELSDSASSTSAGTENQLKKSIGKEVASSTNWETEYIKNILCNLELMFQDFALGQVCEIIDPRIFNDMEHEKDALGGDGGEARLERKALFDCVSECLDLRCRQYIGGGFKAWVRGASMVRRKAQLVEEVHKEISTWRGMGDCMVDELVGKDMSNQHGRWLDFNVDAFVLGTEVEVQILNSLLDEVVADILCF